MYEMRNAGHQPPQSYPRTTKPLDELEHIQLDVYYPLIQKKHTLLARWPSPASLSLVESGVQKSSAILSLSIES